MCKEEKSNTIYHYTSAEGILGIFESYKLQFRFTKADNLNDVSEGCDWLNQIEKACIELKNSNEINQMQFNEVIKFSDKEYIYHFLNDNSATSSGDDEYDYSTKDAYILCFSKKRDCLPMWNYYTNNSSTGYAIGFNSDILLKFFQNIRFNVHHVIYDDATKINALKFMISAWLEKNDYKRIAWELYNYSYRFKHKAFEYEDEIRVIYYYDHRDTDLPEIRFRSRNGLIVPYIQLSFEDSYIKDIINDISIGPLGKDYITKHNLCLFFKNKGFNIDPNTITTSDIPIRF